MFLCSGRTDPIEKADLSERRIRLEVGCIISEAEEVLLEVGVLGLADGEATEAAESDVAAEKRRAAASAREWQWKAASIAAVEHQREQTRG